MRFIRFEALVFWFYLFKFKPVRSKIFVYVMIGVAWLTGPFDHRWNAATVEIDDFIELQTVHFFTKNLVFPLHLFQSVFQSLDHVLLYLAAKILDLFDWLTSEILQLLFEISHNHMVLLT